jgi:hypothetical protein
MLASTEGCSDPEIAGWIRRWVLGSGPADGRLDPEMAGWIGRWMLGSVPADGRLDPEKGCWIGIWVFGSADGWFAAQMVRWMRETFLRQCFPLNGFAASARRALPGNLLVRFPGPRFPSPLVTRHSSLVGDSREFLKIGESFCRLVEGLCGLDARGHLEYGVSAGGTGNLEGTRALGE